jgi:heme transport system substrate-binding protein
VPARGARLAATTQRAIDAARARLKNVTDRPKVAFLYLRGPRVQLLAGKGSRSDTMILAAGARDMGSELGITGTKPLTAESLVVAAPDVIVVLDAGLESVGGREGLMRLPGVAQTPAGQSGRILSYDDLLFLGLGPRTGAALDDLISGVHPELR